MFQILPKIFEIHDFQRFSEFLEIFAFFRSMRFVKWFALDSVMDGVNVNERLLTFAHW